MKSTFCFTTLLLALSLIGCGGAGGGPAQTPQTFAFTSEGGATGGPILLYRLQSESGSLEPGLKQTPDDEFYGGLATHPGRPLLLAARGTPALTAFRVDPSSGSLSRSAETPVSGKFEADDQLLFHPAGRWLCVFQNQELRLFALTSDRGDLAELQTVTPPGAGDLNHGAFDHSGQFLYAVDRAAAKIFGFRVLAEGGLAPLSDLPLAQLTGGYLRSIHIEPGNRYLYLLDDNYDRVVCYARNQDGTLADNGSLVLGPAADPLQSMVGRGSFLYIAEASRSLTRVIRLGEAGEMSPEASYEGGGNRLAVAGELPILLAGDSKAGSLMSQRIQADSSLSASEGQVTERPTIDLKCLTLERRSR